MLLIAEVILLAYIISSHFTRGLDDRRSLYQVRTGGMPLLVENQESQGFAGVLANRVREDAGAAEIAAALLTIWVEIDTVLAPILGERGVALLYKRSLYLTMQSHPWLSHTHEGAETAMHLKALEAAFAQQSNSDAAAAGHSLLLKFHELLASLIGPSLTERLLRSVLAPLEGGQPAQDMTP